ncbi:MAG TPA: hypothetical protein VHQ65_14510 [Thermoanaerobaculia bacterium]|nr:hypothetical protein [Thermoanaerobaculia bacterium]
MTLRRICLALVLVALVVAVPAPAAAAPADPGDVSVLDGMWSQLSDLWSQLVGVLAGSSTTEEPTEPPPTDGGYGLGVDPDGRVPTGDPEESSLVVYSDPECGSLLDPNG